MGAFELAIENLTSPPLLAFVLGALAVLVKSDLRLPDPVHTWLASYLLLAIGLKGGHALKAAELGAMVLPVLTTLFIGVTLPLAVFAISRVFLRTSIVDAGSLAAHYGSVSVVTFTAAMTFAEEAGFEVEGFITTLVALLEVPGIIVGLLLVVMKRSDADMKAAVREVMTGRSILLLAGGLVIGLVASDRSFARVAPLFVDLFTGFLVLFLLDMGATAMTRLRVSRTLTMRVVLFAVVWPLCAGAIGVCLGAAVGMSHGGAGVFGAMAASASYIAAPAAIHTALPQADAGLSLGAALGITFPVNLAIGIPLYLSLAQGLC